MALMAVVLLVAACAPQPAATEAPGEPAPPAPTEQAAAPSAPEEKVPVTVLSLGADWLLASLWDSAKGEETALLTDFEEKYGIDVKFESLPEDTARQKMMLDFSSHTGQYDIVTTDAWNLGTYASAGYLEPLDDWVANYPNEEYLGFEDFLPSNLEAGSYGGKLYTMPLYTFGPALVYNKALFEQYGVKVPETVEELEEAAAALTLDTDGDGQTDIYGITMRARAGEEPTIDVTGLTWAYGGSWFEGNANTVEEIKADKALPAVNSPEFIAGYEEYAKLLQNWGPPESANWGWEECMGALAQGKAAMHLAASSAYWFTRATGTVPPEDIGIAYSPMGDGGHRMMNFFDLGLSINADSAEKEAAWTVLQFITSAEVQQAQAAAGITSLPRTSLVLSDELKAIYPEDDLEMVLETLETAESDYMPKIPEYTEICNILGTAASVIVAGTISAQEALDAAQVEITQIMEDAGYYE
jgi:ABC-type glycerol-3-phosphate transport system substrate-binding protein